MRQIVLFAVCLFLGNLVIASQVMAQSLAVNGYDVVAYFDLKPRANAVKGTTQFQTRHNGMIYYFSSAENMREFQSNPFAYLPQYDGYCAYAIMQGGKLGSDPQAWTVHNGKLYLNYNKTVRGLWYPNRTSYISAADKNWPAIRAQK